ncbi:DNA methyltransferase [candidate division TA06 bacterium DG_78]|uniref:DNA methyltransferase n=1 Tax=candidate division TA06 bacterium DG_78 TaxID=1703772 RepID=A0A0S7YGT8_UNCT6|nr:MAG: DNA methyltransferase [candidate division TA06 bacterium DG_78]
MKKTFYQSVIDIIKQIPYGKVATYGQIAKYAGNPQAARQVAYILHSSSEKESLPWHRVINSKGGISLKLRQGYELQKQLLGKEGVVFNRDDCVDLQQFLWLP